MTEIDAYRTYIAALEAYCDVPKVYAAQVDSIDRASRDEVAKLERRRQDEAQRWTHHRDVSSRLARRVNEMSGNLGLAPSLARSPELLAVQSIPGALDSLRLSLDRSEQSWQWLVRHRERLAREARPVSPPPLVPNRLAPQPMPSVAPLPERRTVSPAVLICIAVAVVIAVIVIVAIAI